MKTQIQIIIFFCLALALTGCIPQPMPVSTPTMVDITSTPVPPTLTPKPTDVSVPTIISTEVNQKGVLNGNQFCNEAYHLQFNIPDGWEIYGNEDFNSGANAYKVYFSAPGFVEEVPPFAEFILSVAVMEVPFELHKAGMLELIGNATEENLLVDNRESYNRIGTHEFGGILNIVLIPDGENIIEFVLRTNDEPYRAAFYELLESISLSTKCIE